MALSVKQLPRFQLRLRPGSVAVGRDSRSCCCLKLRVAKNSENAQTDPFLTSFEAYECAFEIVMCVCRFSFDLQFS